MADPTQFPDISPYLDLFDRFIERKLTAAEFEASFLQMMKHEHRTLGDPIYPLLQELFEDADAYVESPELRTEPEDLDDEQLLGCAIRTRQALRDIGFE
ncbi:MAG: hypothetical protein PVSMB1_06000 [Gemmatimonadaceae bacterium]